MRNGLHRPTRLCSGAPPGNVSSNASREWYRRDKPKSITVIARGSFCTGVPFGSSLEILAPIESYGMITLGIHPRPVEHDVIHGAIPETAVSVDLFLKKYHTKYIPVCDFSLMHKLEALTRICQK